MALAIILSLFFGLTAALALAVCFKSGIEGLAQARTIRAELATMDRRVRPKSAPLRQFPKGAARAWQQAAVRV